MPRRAPKSKAKPKAKARSTRQAQQPRAGASKTRDRVLDLQRTAGNRAVGDLLKTRDGKPHAVENVPPVVDAALDSSPGKALEPATRAAMESALDADFSGVRVHDDALAGQSADAVNALAYTSGQDIVFGAGQFAPDTAEGLELLLHEAAHVAEHQGDMVGGRVAGARSIERAPKPAAADPPSLFASTIPAPRVTRVGGSIFVTVYFGHNNFLMDARNLDAVEKLADELRFMFKPDVLVDGFASGEGKPADNLKLSEMRRQTVIAFLNKAGSKAEIGGTAHGDADFAVEEAAKGGAELEAQRARNRRVTIMVIGSAAPVKEKEKKPIKIFSPRITDLPEETDSERLNRLLKERSRLPSLERPKISLTDKFWENVDDTVDRVTKKVTSNKKIRDLIRDGVHKAIEKGAEEVLDQAIDQANLDKSQKDAIKAGIKAGIQFKF